jgi:L-histidine N-alpha-methyltransferase
MQRNRLELVSVNGPSIEGDFAHDVRKGLTADPKHLPPKYFYDALGSALFEAICQLPEYYLTRAETEILKTYSDEIAGSLNGRVRLVELGSGSASKSRYLIEAFIRRQGELHYQPVDISRTMLEESSRALLNDYPKLQITAIAGDYTRGIELASPASARATKEQVLVLFLGSNIGNYNRDEAIGLLREMRGSLRVGDGLLLGADLKKDSKQLVAAYDDPLGVTSAFNLNLLARINRELGGNFDVHAFEHRAWYNDGAGRMEMHLESLRAQEVEISEIDLCVAFEKGEKIHTENSHKFDSADLEKLAQASGFRIEKFWRDSQSRFSSSLWIAA